MDRQRETFASIDSHKTRAELKILEIQTGIDVTVSSSVCLSRLHGAQLAEDTDTISFAYDSPMFLSDHVKICFTSVISFLSKLCCKLTHPC